MKQPTSFGAPSPPTESRWTVKIEPLNLSAAALGNHFLPQVRSELERRLVQQPDTQEFRLQHPLYTVLLRLDEGRWTPGANLTFTILPPKGQHAPTKGGASSGEASGGDLPSLRLPDPKTAAVAAQLIGLDTHRSHILQYFRCLWDEELKKWSERVQMPLPSVLQTHFSQSVPLMLFHGDPGVGKSALARVVANEYCRQQGIPGTFLWLTTEARGNGLVGDFGNRLRAGFAALAQLPAEEFGCLVIDEADAIAMRRSESHAHQEDRAATATLLQELDALAGQPRRVVIMTTNLLSTMDAAVCRRGTAYAFERPDADARRVFLKRWLPHVEGRELEKLVKASQELTPVDMERTLVHAYLTALRLQRRLEPAELVTLLRRTNRTRSV